MTEARGATMTSDEAMPCGEAEAAVTLARRGGPGRLSRRAALRLLGALPLAAGLAGPTRSPGAWAQDAPAGAVAVPRGREVVLVRADGAGERVAVALPPGEFVADVALSPDGALLAFGRFSTPTGGGTGGSDIMVAPVDGSGPPRTIAERDGPGTLLAAPYFLPDGLGILFESIGLTGAGLPMVRTDLVGTDGNGRRPLVDNGRYSTVSADGQTLAYIKSQMTGDALWTRPLAGGPERQLLSEQDLLLVAFPRFKPDGSTLLLAGVGDSARSPNKLLVGEAPPRRLVPAWAERTAGVMAHGLPVDPWLVGADGANLRRFSQLSIDDAAVAWSPDGRWIAVGGADGVRILSAADGTQTVVSTSSSFGAIDWR